MLSSNPLSPIQLGTNLGVASLFGSTSLGHVPTFDALAFGRPVEHFGTVTVYQRPAVKSLTSTSGALATPNVTKSTEEKLFDSKADAKRFMSQIATRIQEKRKKQLYRQLDSILDIDEWIEGDEPLTLTSYQTFMRLMLVIQPDVKPGLGLTADGHLIATWSSGDARLSIYCFANDVLRYVLSHVVDNRRETHAGDASIKRLKDCIAPFNPRQWFSDEPD